MAIFGKKNLQSRAANKPKALSYRLAAGSSLVPVVSEKATRLQQQGQYMFAVNGEISKVDVKKAIESTFGVKVVGVNKVNLPGKVVRRGRDTGQRKVRQHLIVRVAAGETIDLGKSL